MAEKRETELDLLQRLRSKGAESKGREVMLGTLLTSERQATLHTHERGRRDTTEERETRLRRTSTNQRERLTVETPEDREMRLQRMRDRLCTPFLIKTMSSIYIANCTGCIAPVV